MKVYLLFMAFSLSASASAFVGSRAGDNSQPAAISISDTRENYVFTARYDNIETSAVERFINRKISPDRMGSSEKDMIDAWTTLSDHTRFQIKESAGSLEISIKKGENAASSIARIKKLCEGIKQLLTKK
jgi:hypothetical protein